MASVSDNLTITSVQARKAILKAFKAKRPLFLWGPPGIGKSEVVAEVADELGGHVIDLRMAQMEPTDIRGIPYFNRDINKMDWAAPVDLPDEELASQYPIVVLFLDEMNSASPAVQAAGYQLILNRRVGKYVLPDNVVIVAAGNRDSDKGVTYRMPMPLANRFLHLEMRADFTAWQTWAVNKAIHKDVVGYLSFAKQDLYEFDSKSSSRAFATPRSWCFVSDLLNDDDDVADAVIEVALDGVQVTDTASQLHGDLTAYLAQDSPDSALVDRLAGKGAVQVDQVQAPRAGVQPAPRHGGRVLTEGGGDTHVSLLKADAVAVLQVDGGDQQHGS